MRNGYLSHQVANVPQVVTVEFRAICTHLVLASAETHLAIDMALLHSRCISVDQTKLWAHAHHLEQPESSDRGHQSL